MAINPKRRTVLITGCSSGFGRQMVSEFLKCGWTVLATMRRATERAEEFKEELSRYGNQLVILELDVTSKINRISVLEAVERAGGTLDCLINNAGYMLLGAFEESSEAQMRKQMETNIFGAMFLTQEFLPLLRKSGGTIINVSSIFGSATWPLTSVYCASKWALEGWSQSLRQELEPHGVRVALIEPGSHPTSLVDNLEWADSVAKDSVYYADTQAYRAFRSSLSGRDKIEPSDVAAVAAQIAQAAHTPFRVPVGMDSKFVAIAVRLLPELFGVKLMMRLSRRLWRRAAVDTSSH